MLTLLSVLLSLFLGFSLGTLLFTQYQQVIEMDIMTLHKKVPLIPQK
jgi:hypothetical protein